MTPNELFAKELMTYDVGTDSNNTFYNNLPYKKDYDLCNWRPLRVYSGNVIKFYQYQIGKPVVLCTDPADGVFTAETIDPEQDEINEDIPEEMTAEIPGDEMEDEQPLDTE